MLAFLQTAIPIFLLRLVDISFYTLRLMTMTRARKGLVWVFAFLQSFVYASALRAVFSDLGDWSKVAGYVTGYATGLIVGMWIEERLGLGHTHLRIISSKRGTEISEHLRSSGYAVTEVSAMGMKGAVALLNCSVLRKDARDVKTIAIAVDPEAFITSQAVRPVQRGYWHH